MTAVDSSGTQPILKIYTADASWNKTSTVPLFTADPRNISAGSSLWQYFTVAGTRPAFTWQYNWQTKIPGTNTNLPAGNYLAIIEVPATNQTEGGKGAVATVRVTLTP